MFSKTISSIFCLVLIGLINTNRVSGYVGSYPGSCNNDYFNYYNNVPSQYGYPNSYAPYGYPSNNFVEVESFYQPAIIETDVITQSYGPYGCYNNYPSNLNYPGSNYYADYSYMNNVNYNPAGYGYNNQNSYSNYGYSQYNDGYYNNVNGFGNVYGNNLVENFAPQVYPYNYACGPLVDNVVPIQPQYVNSYPCNSYPYPYPYPYPSPSPYPCSYPYQTTVVEDIVTYPSYPGHNHGYPGYPSFPCGC